MTSRPGYNRPGFKPMMVSGLGAPAMIDPSGVLYGMEVSMTGVSTLVRQVLEFAYSLKVATSPSQRNHTLRALDLGCGTGKNAERLAHLGFSVTAIDLCECGEAIEGRNFYLNSIGYPPIAFLKGNLLEKMPMEEKPFPIILLAGVLHFMEGENIETLFRQLARITTSESRIGIGMIRLSDQLTDPSLQARPLSGGPLPGYVVPGLPADDADFYKRDADVYLYPAQNILSLAGKYGFRPHIQEILPRHFYTILQGPERAPAP